MATRSLFFAALVIVWHPAGAQSGFDPGRTVELPAHRALQRIMAREDTALAPFTTDGCSGGLSASWTVVADQFPDFAEAHGGVPPWQGCCVSHDRAYHDAGGTLDADASYDARLVADTALRACVEAEGETRIEVIADLYGVQDDTVRQAYVTIAGSMFLAVRLGGGPCTGLPWRWGYGYPQCVTLPGDFTAD
ncbi:MAG: hypothetical protein AAGK37_05500 [Pseudomonadota bacterium]